MADENTLFLFATGAGSCERAPDLICNFLAQEYTVSSSLTPNVTAGKPPAPLVDVPGYNRIHEFRKKPLDRYPFGMLLVGPCTLNPSRKIALRLADNLATPKIAMARVPVVQ